MVQHVSADGSPFSPTLIKAPNPVKGARSIVCHSVAPRTALVNLGHSPGGACAKSPDATEFRAMVDPLGYTETWSEGIYLFHNPRATYPLVPQLFPDASHTLAIGVRLRWPWN